MSTVLPEMLDAWSRMLRLLDAWDEVEVLALLIARKILVRILQGPQGALLHQTALAGSRIAQVRVAIGHLRTDLHCVVRIEELAAIATFAPLRP